MCGIAGVFDPGRGGAAYGELVRKMCAVLRHRGPDDEGVYEEPGLAIGMRRLSIIDLETGHQPIADESGKLQLAANGEVYNFEELRHGLEGRGHRFSTRTDVEVIVHLYEEKGEACVQDLRGMFAFALWDGRKRRLLLARDRAGQKPLYYATHGGAFMFASEPKSILQAPGFERRMDLEALDDYLTYQYVPSPRCMFSGIRKLEPAHYMTVDARGVRSERYWRLHPGKKTALGEDEICERLRELLEEATKLRLVSDVPLGAFLSGGMDSSAVVGMMARHTHRPVKTFSIGFEDKAYDELGYARAVARHFGTEHHEFTVRPDVIRVLPRLVWHYNEPFADSSMVPTYYVSKMTREHVTVALNGDGGDESFGGYPRYRALLLARSYARLPSWLRTGVVARLEPYVPDRAEPKSLLRRGKRFLRAMALGGDRCYLHWISSFGPQEKSRLYGPALAEELAGRDAGRMLERLVEESGCDDPLDRILYADTNSYLPEDLLVKVDIASMANSLESRSPFLDHKLMEFAASIPSHLKVRGGTSKYILKRALGGFLPDSILSRPKMGFGVPIARWFRSELKGYLSDILLDGQARKREYFRQGEVEAMIARHAEGRTDESQRLWVLLNLELWHRMFIDRMPDTTPPAE